MKEYKVLGASSSEYFENRMNELSREGWELHSWRTSQPGSYIAIMTRQMYVRPKKGTTNPGP